ncbi:MAG: amidohydrolase, partial [Candidatus Eisenbacteria bacterium]|nr:amidohydrolase [Candidatus Eisenbacteria bacterium]
MTSEAEGPRREVLERREAMIELRRAIHQQPELGMKEESTARAILEILKPAFPQVRGSVGGTGVTALLSSPGSSSSRAILLRADMDALPIQEETAAPYASRQPGVMHACGHDGHVAILAQTALVAAGPMAKRLRHPVRFVFQPAEEGPGGALPMIRAGVLSDPPVEAAFGLHLWSGLPAGVVAVTSGPMMASADEFELRIVGRGGHGASPHETVDAVVVASHLVTALQTLVSRNVDPMQTAVVTVGMLHAGDNFNIIAETARLRGTIRSFLSLIHIS